MGKFFTTAFILMVSFPLKISNPKKQK